jgi:hypothetical protein
MRKEGRKEGRTRKEGHGSDDVTGKKVRYDRNDTQEGRKDTEGRIRREGYGRKDAERRT